MISDEEKAKRYDFLVSHYSRSCSVSMDGNHLWALHGFSGTGMDIHDAIGNVMNMKEL